MREFLVDVERRRSHTSSKELLQQQAELNGQLLRWLTDAEADFAMEETDLAVLEKCEPSAMAAVDPDVDKLREQVAQIKPLQTKVMELGRKCDLLKTLEADGRLENTELHKVSCFCSL